jgi:hypothetical protein
MLNAATGLSHQSEQLKSEVDSFLSSVKGEDAHKKDDKTHGRNPSRRAA